MSRVTDSWLDHQGRQRVAVTGIGVKTPAGNDVRSMWSQIVQGLPVAGPITSFDASGLPVRFAGEVSADGLNEYFGPKEARRLDRCALLGVAAGLDAVADACLPAGDPARRAVVAGSGMGGWTTVQNGIQEFLRGGPSRMNPFLVPMAMPNATGDLLGIRLGWCGPSICISTACASGANAIGEGCRLIRDGSANVVLAGGSEALVAPVAMSAFARMGALSTRNADPVGASRPFDKQRDGFVMSEGGAFVVIESWAHAMDRGARIYGEVVGYGRNVDAHHIAAPLPGGGGAAACMQLALDDAGLAPSAVGHINAHGTSTPLNDLNEASAIEKVFGTLKPMVTSTKGVLGHMIAAAGAVEVVATLLALGAGIVPPTANHFEADDEMNLDIVSGAPKPVAPGLAALSNSFGFGGHNVSLVMSPYHESHAA